MKLKSGMIVGTLKNAVDRTYESFLSGSFYRFLTGKGELQKKADSCAIARLPEELSEAMDPVLNPHAADAIRTPVERDENGVMLGSRSARELPLTPRQKISGVFRESRVISFVDALTKRAGSMRLRSLGVFLLMLGIVSTVLHSVLFAVGATGGLLSDLLGHCLFCVLLIAAALILVGGGDRQLFDTLSESVVGSALWYSALGFRKTARKVPERVDDRTETNLLHVLPVLLGMLGGILSVWIPMQKILLGVLVLIFMTITLYMPEAGLVVLFAAFPYVALIGNGYTALGFCCLWIHFGWFIKYLNGKRNFRFRLTDLFFFLFAIFWMLGGAVSAGRGGIWLGLSGMCIALLYFPAVNLLSSEEFVRKCIRSFLLGSLSVSVIGIFRFLKATVFTGGKFNGFAESSVFQSPDLLALYLGISLILLIFTAGERRRVFRSFGFFAILFVNAGGLLLSGSYLVIGALLLTAVIYLITSSRKTVGNLLLLVPALVILYVLLPAGIREFLNGLWNHTDRGIRYKFGVWQEILPTVRAYAFTGVGITEDAWHTAALGQGMAAEYEQVYNHYLQTILHVGVPGLLLLLTMLFITLKKSVGTYLETEKGSILHALAAGASVSAVFIIFYGMGDYFWTHSTGFLLFFIVLALNVAVSRIHGSNAERIEEMFPEDIDIPADVSGLRETRKTKKHIRKENDKNNPKPKGPEVTISDSDS